jgi:hypothetical protein
MRIGGLAKIKCRNYCEYHCENFTVFLRTTSGPHKGKSLDACDEFSSGVLLT